MFGTTRQAGGRPREGAAPWRGERDRGAEEARTTHAVMDGAGARPVDDREADAVGRAGDGAAQRPGAAVVAVGAGGAGAGLRAPGVRARHRVPPGPGGPRRRLADRRGWRPGAAAAGGR